jgi:hypothetical protein
VNGIFIIAQAFSTLGHQVLVTHSVSISVSISVSVSVSVQVLVSISISLNH